MSSLSTFQAYDLNPATTTTTTFDKAGASRRKPAGKHAFGTSLEPCCVRGILQALGSFGLLGILLCSGGFINGGNGADINMAV